MKKFLAAFIALVMALAVMPAVNADDAPAEPYWTVPEGYCADDYNAMAAFLETEDENGVKNGEWLSPYYNVNDPSTWVLCEEWQAGGIIWGIIWEGDIEDYPEPADGIRHVKSVLLPDYFSPWGPYGLHHNIPGYTGMVGSLDLRNLAAIENLNIQYTRVSEVLLPSHWMDFVNIGGSCVTEIDLSVCPEIYNFLAHEFQYVDLAFQSTDFSSCQAIYTININQSNVSEINVSGLQSLNNLNVSYNQLTELDVSTCTDLSFLDCSVNEITELDVSNLNLFSLNCGYNQLTELDITNSEQLSFLNCLDNNLNELDLTHCHMLTDLYCAGNRLTEIDLSCCESIPICMIVADGPGYVGCWYGSRGYYHQLNAVPEEGAVFEGWYASGQGQFELLSTELDYDFDLNADPYTVYVALFSEGVEPIPGDIDMSGAVEVTDAIMALRSAMGIIGLTEEQLAAGDMNGDGTIGIEDAIVILRTAMGLLG